MHRWHQLPVFPEQTLRTQQDHGVVETSGPGGFPFVHSKHAVDVVFGTCLDETVDLGTGDVDRIGPEAGPHLIKSVEPGRFAGPYP